MADKTNIAWARSTFNPWIGCTKVAPECDNCYAAEMDARRRWDGGKTHWGAGVPRYLTGKSTWAKPAQWNRLSLQERQTGAVAVQWRDEWDRPGFWPVFGGSLMDWGDNEVNPAWRTKYWCAIDAYRALTWLLLTKRGPNIARMVPPDFSSRTYAHVWLGVTAGTQERVDTDGMRLLDIDASVSFLSIEPMLEPINIDPWLERARRMQRQAWVIVGGESGSKARSMHREWAEQVLDDCARYEVPAFMKQMGSFIVDRNDAGFDGCESGSWPLRPDGCDPLLEHNPHGYVDECQGADVRIRLVDRAGADPAEWPEDIRVREFPA